MVLDLLNQLIPWGLGLLIFFFVWLIVLNRKRLHKIRYSGRVSEIIDRRRNIIVCYIVIGVLAVFLFVNLLA